MSLLKKSLEKTIKQAAKDAANASWHSFLWMNKVDGEAFKFIEHEGVRYCVSVCVERVDEK